MEGIEMKNYFFCFFAAICLIATSGDPAWAKNQINAKIRGGKTMVITSSSFVHEDMIPAKYTCDGQNISPPLAWSGAPKETNSFALICDDPDAPAGTWVHWVIFDIPANVNSLPEKVAKQEAIAGLGKNGKNTSQHFGYDGPCPPSGTHRYYFKLYALDKMLNLKAGLSKEELLSAMKNHVLAEAQIMGRYKR
jgi:Raf kinase inhibitor-like YbhB/YbcL family protein